MVSRWIVVMIAFSLIPVLSLGLFAADRLPDGTVVEFIVPVGTVINNTEFVIFAGPPTLAVALDGNCAVGDSSPLQEAIVVDPGAGAVRRMVIVTQVAGVSNPAAVPVGTRLGPLTQLEKCGSTNEFQKYRAFVE